MAPASPRNPRIWLAGSLASRLHCPVPMKQLIACASLALFLTAASGCVVHRYPASTQRVVVVKEKGCHPSQYWDGSKCRHKGKGWGARKHDD